MSWIDHVGAAVTEHSGLVVAVLVLVTAGFGAGIGAVEQSTAVSGLSGDTETAQAYDTVRSDFSNRDGATTTMLIAIENESGNALSKASLLETLRYQRALEANRTLEETLVEERPTESVANVVALAAIADEQRQERNGTTVDAGEHDPPSLDEQITQLESMDSDAVAAVVRQVRDPSTPSAASRTVTRLLPRGVEPTSTTASSHLLVVTQETAEDVRVDVALSDAVVDGQQAARSLALDQPSSETYHVFGGALMSTQQSAAIGDSLAILGPLALLFVLVSLSIAYRDPIDVVLGLAGVVVVLLWTFGTMGWLGIAFNQTMIAVPILLIGLSVDYALHVVMRYRERRTETDDGVRPAMGRALSGVGPALVLVTATTAIGFLANYTSPMGDIRSFGLVSAVGIVATLLVFGLLVPALKTVIASMLERRGWDRTPSPPGSTGPLRRMLRAGAVAARRRPLAMVVLAIVLSSGAAYGATTVTVASPDSAFMADDPPDWTEELPDPVQPGEFYLKDNRNYIDSRFQTPDTQGYVLVDGNVTTPGTPEAVAAAERTAIDSSVVLDRPDGSPAVVTPLSAMERAAATSETFNATLQSSDTDGDGVPDRNIRALYDAFYATAPDLAARTIHRTDGDERDEHTYTALRLRIAVDGTVDRGDAVAPLRDSADAFGGVDGVDGVATGQPVVSKELNDRVATTLIESLVLTIAVVLGLLAVVFRLREASASLGVVTLAPVVCSVSWLLGTMALLDIPIGLITALVGSIAVGLGVDYAIHVSDRFAQEYTDDIADMAVMRTVTGTGGALLSSAVTTATGFGVLSLSLLPGLRQFGFVLAVGIVYAFLASVVVQPSLLILWARYGSKTATSKRSSVGTGDD
jgi:predicted RND superfamily exporter protein